MAKIDVYEFSPAHSFKGWDLIEFLKGRKKLLVTEIGIVLATLGVASKEVTLITAVTAAVFEMGFAVYDYWKKEK